MVYKLFFYMYENHIPSEEDEHTLYINKFDERIQTSLCYIEDNLMDGSSIEDVAANVSLSPSHFSRLFGTTDLSINDIAAKVGVSNGNYISTLFKKRYGITPTDYRKEIKKSM